MSTPKRSDAAYFLTMMMNDNCPMVDVKVCREGKPRGASSLGRISVTPQKEVQDVGLSGMMVAGPIRELSELLPPSFPIIVQRARIRHGDESKVPLDPSTCVSSISSQSTGSYGTNRCKRSGIS